MAEVYVYIITEEGRSYTDEGLDYVASVMKENFGVDRDDICFYSGMAFNAPEALAKHLEKHPDSYIVVSTAEDIIFIPNTVIDKVCENLRDEPNETSWRVLMCSCGRLKL